MKHLIFDCERMKYASTGLYHYCLSLSRALNKKINRNEEHLTFFTPWHAQPVVGLQQKHITQHSLQKFYLPSLKNYHVWHSTYQSSDYVPQRNRKIKVVLSIHDLNFLYEHKAEGKKIKYLKHLQENINRSDAIVCISEFCKKDVMENCNTGNKPVYVIHNGTNHLPDPSLTDVSYRPKRPFLFSMGVICRKKNFHVLLPLLKLNRGLELLIAGRQDDWDYLQFIRHSAQKMKVDDNVRLLGNISENEKSWYYRNCYAFALPSMAEGFGLPVTEAMSVGKPLFLSNRTALPEIGSNVAFYFQDFSESHIQNVFQEGMRDYEENKMQDAIMQRGEMFCWDKAADQYLEVYRSLY